MAVDIVFPTHADVHVYDMTQDDRRLQWQFKPEHQGYYLYDSDSAIRERLDVYSGRPSSRIRRRMMSAAGGVAFGSGTVVWAHREAWNMEWQDWFGHTPDVCSPGTIKQRMLDSFSWSKIPKFLWAWYMGLIIDMYIDGPGPWFDTTRTIRSREEFC